MAILEVVETVIYATGSSQKNKEMALYQGLHKSCINRRYVVGSETLLYQRL